MSLASSDDFEVSSSAVRHPTSSLTFNKSSDYIESIQRDIDRLFEEEFTDKFHTPQYVHKLGQDVGHPSRESLLFKTKLLASNKMDQQMGGHKRLREAMRRESEKRRRPATAVGVNGQPTQRKEYYRPNSTHQYLTATDVRDRALDSADPRLGRPTRTTLLRAQNRVQSAPVNAYQVRRMQHQEQQDRVQKRPFSSADVNREINMRKSTEVDGDPIHAFLVGARYNSAHYVDRKAIDRLGVYMPRASPADCFIRSEPGRSESSQPTETPPSTRPQTAVLRPTKLLESSEESDLNPVNSFTSMGTTNSGALLASELASTCSLQGEEQVGPTPTPRSATAETNPPLNIRGSRINSAVSESRGPPSSTPTGQQKRVAFANFVYGGRASSAGVAISPLPAVFGQSIRGHTQDFVRRPGSEPGRPRARVPANPGRLSSGHAKPGKMAPEMDSALSVRKWQDPKSIRVMIQQQAAARKVKTAAPMITPEVEVTVDEVEQAEIESTKSRPKSSASSRPRSAWSGGSGTPVPVALPVEEPVVTSVPKNTPRVVEEEKSSVAPRVPAVSTIQEDVETAVERQEDQEEELADTATPQSTTEAEAQSDKDQKQSSSSQLLATVLMPSMDKEEEDEEEEEEEEDEEKGKADEVFNGIVADDVNQEQEQEQEEQTPTNITVHVVSRRSEAESTNDIDESGR